jgi:hydroxyquinol 1,2-dioxygenase
MTLQTTGTVNQKRKKPQVFGVRASLVCDFKGESDPATAERMGLPAQYFAIDLPIRLASED